MLNYEIYLEFFFIFSIIKLSDDPNASLIGHLLRKSFTSNMVARERTSSLSMNHPKLSPLPFRLVCSLTSLFSLGLCQFYIILLCQTSILSSYSFIELDSLVIVQLQRLSKLVDSKNRKIFENVLLESNLLVIVKTSYKAYDVPDSGMLLLTLLELLAKTC